MKRERSRHRGKDSLELIEEAIHLLRSAPLSHLMVYYFGTLPFVLAALYFWSDMSRSPFAGQHLAGAALSLACLFVWMKTCQAIFSRQLRCSISGESPAFNPARVGRILLTQSAIQPTGLFLLPLALVPLLPFPWVFAFYQNLSVLDDGDSVDARTLIKKAVSQAFLWPRQNHFLLAIMSGFGLFVFLNLITACFALPGLVKMLFGIDTIFTRSGLLLLNTTFFAATFGLAYLCLDPILKTVYALRCFYGESQRSGSDLKAELRRVVTARLAAILLPILLSAIGLEGTSLLADDQSDPHPTPPAASGAPLQRTVASSVSAPELDLAIREVIRQARYAWREPRKRMVETAPAEAGIFGRFLNRAKSLLINGLKTLGRWLDSLFRRLFFRQTTTYSNDGGYRWIVFLRLLVYALIAAAVAGLVWLVYGVWKGRRGQPGIITSEPLQPALDLMDENLEADQLPEDGWTELARKLLARGEFRLALRAFYLANLAQLATNSLIHLARFKSNRDYERELSRRAHAFPELLSAFEENRSVFDRIWYGMHEINSDIVNRFAANVERMKTTGADSPPPAAAT